MHKGVIDFAKYRAKLTVVDENSFQITVPIQQGDTSSKKVFTFRTIKRGSLATWITIINLHLGNVDLQLKFN